MPFQQEIEDDKILAQFDRAAERHMRKFFTASELAEGLDMTAEGVRQRLLKLEGGPIESRTLSGTAYWYRSGEEIWTEPEIDGATPAWWFYRVLNKLRFKYGAFLFGQPEPVHRAEVKGAYEQGYSRIRTVAYVLAISLVALFIHIVINNPTLNVGNIISMAVVTVSTTVVTILALLTVFLLWGRYRFEE